MAAEGGYAVSGQFNAIADSAARAVLDVTKLANEFAAFSAATFSVASSVKAFADLQQTLVLTNSIAGGTAKELQNMNNAVRDMALGFKFSATEGAQALYFLSSAGFSVQQSLSAMNGVALLAQATLTDLAQTSDTIANTLSAFNLEADQSTRIANLFAASISVTQATMDKLAYSMRYVGPVAHEMGASVEQTVVALSGLYQVGNRGQQAGTLLRDVLIRLVNPSAEAATVLSKVGISVADADGKVRNFVDILKDLQQVNLSPISLAKIFEQRGVAGASTLISLFDPKDFERRLKDTNGVLTEFGTQVKNVTDKAGKNLGDLTNMWDYLTLAETNTNFATRLALQQNATLSASFSRASNAVKELGIAFGEQLAPGMQAIANTLTTIAVGFRNLDDGTKKLIGDLPFVVVGVLGAVKAWGLLVGMVERATTAFGNVRNNASAIGNFFRGTPSPAAGAVAGAAAGAGALTLNTARLEAEILLLRGILGTTNAELATLVAAIARLTAVMAVPAASRALAATAPGAVFSQVPRPAVPPPIPNAVTGAAASAATTAATSAGAAVGAGAALRAAGGVVAAVLAGITGIVGIVLTAVSLAGLVALAWPLVKDYMNRQPGKASFQAKDFSGEADQAIASVNQQPISPFKKSQNLQTVAEGLGEEYKFFQDALKDATKSADDANTALKEYVAAQLELQGQGALAAKVRADVSGNLAKVFQSDVRFTTDTKFKELKSQYDNASRDVDNAKKSLNDYSKAAASIAAEQARLASLPSFKIEQVATQQANDVAKGNGKVVILDKYIKELQKEARDAEAAARKAQLLLKNDPVQQFLSETADELQKNADKIKTFGSKVESDIQGGTSNLKTVLAKIIGGYGPGAFAQIISGGEFNFKDDAGNIQVVKSVADQIAAGVPIDDVIAAYKASVERFLAKANVTQPDIKNEIGLVVGAFEKFINGIAKEQKAQIQNKLFAMIAAQQANEEFANKLRDTYSKIQEGYITAVSEAIGQGIPQLKLRVDLGGLERSLRDQLADIRKQRIELLKKAGAEAEGKTPEENAAAIQSANNWATSAANAAQQQYYQQVRNRVAEAIAAQKRIADEIKLQQATARTTQASLNADLADLYAKFGMKIPQNVFNSAADLEFAQTDQKIQQQLNDLKNKAQQLRTQITELDRFIQNPAAATAAGSAPKLSIEVTGGPTDKMLDAMTKGTQDFSDKFGINLTSFNTKFEDTLKKFLLDFSSAIGKPITVQTPQDNINARTGSFAAPTGGSGLPSYITNGTAFPVQAPAQALPFSAAQPLPVSVVSGSSDFLYKSNYANTGNAQVGVGQNVTVSNGLSFTAGAQAADALKNFVNDLIAAGAPVRSIGGENVRNIAGTNTLSQHAYGNAIDINQSARDVVSADFRQWIEQNQDAFRSALKNNGIVSGGDWKNPDLGHFEYGGTASGNPPAANSNVPDAAKIKEATDAYQAYAAATGQVDQTTKQTQDTLAQMAQTQQQVTTTEQQTVQTAIQRKQAAQEELAATTQAAQTVAQMQAASKGGQLSPDSQDIAKWQEYQRVVSEASKTLAGSNDMMRGFQVANAQLALQVGRDAKLASDVYASAANSIATNLTALITGTQKDWRVALKNIATDIATTIIKALILRALTGLGGSLFGTVGGASVPSLTGGGTSSLFSAKGTAYDMGGQITPFATGGVFDSPTGFDYMSNGRKRKGMMGEAGPEAIMPLVRGPDGKLAIRALSTPITPINPGGGGGGMGGYSYNPSFTFMGSDGSTSSQPNSGSRQERNRLAAMQKELDREMESTVVRVMSKHSRNGGLLNQSAQRLGLAGGN